MSTSPGGQLEENTTNQQAELIDVMQKKNSFLQIRNTSNKNTMKQHNIFFQIRGQWDTTFSN